MGLSANCWKYIVLTFNVLFAMSALVLFAVSGYLLYRMFIYRHFLGVAVEYPVILLLVLSIIACSIAWLGWTTAMSMSRLHVILVGLLIFLVVVAEFACFVWAMVLWDNLDIDIKTTMLPFFQLTAEANDPNSANSVKWDRLHVQFECCGMTGPSDYSTSGHVPFSCCGQGPLDAVHKPYVTDCTALYQRGCAKLLHAYARQHMLWVAMCGLIASVLQSSGIFCTYFLVRAIGDRRTSIRNSTISADVSLLNSPSAPPPTLPKY